MRVSKTLPTPQIPSFHPELCPHFSLPRSLETTLFQFAVFGASVFVFPIFLYFEIKFQKEESYLLSASLSIKIITAKSVVYDFHYKADRKSNYAVLEKKCEKKMRTSFQCNEIILCNFKKVKVIIVSFKLALGLLAFMKL